jgi:hypothetical protein
MGVFLVSIDWDKNERFGRIKIHSDYSNDLRYCSIFTSSVSIIKSSSLIDNLSQSLYIYLNSIFENTFEKLIELVSKLVKEFFVDQLSRLHNGIVISWIYFYEYSNCIWRRWTKFIEYSILKKQIKSEWSRPSFAQLFIRCFLFF